VDVPAGDLEVDVIDGHEAAEFLREVVGFQYQVAHASPLDRNALRDFLTARSMRGSASEYHAGLS
jgi:hypothetical protein